MDINEKSSWWDAGVCSSTVLHTGHLINARTGPGDDRRGKKNISGQGQHVLAQWKAWYPRLVKHHACCLEELLDMLRWPFILFPKGLDLPSKTQHAHQLLNIHLSLCLSPEIPINFWNCSSYVFPPLFHKTHTHICYLSCSFSFGAAHTRLSVWVSIQRMIPNGLSDKVESKEGWGIQRKINTLGQWVFLW